jgi:hypothetical protein
VGKRHGRKRKGKGRGKQRQGKGRAKVFGAQWTAKSGKAKPRESVWGTVDGLKRQGKGRAKAFGAQWTAKAARQSPRESVWGTGRGKALAGKADGHGRQGKNRRKAKAAPQSQKRAKPRAFFLSRARETREFAARGPMFRISPGAGALKSLSANVFSEKSGRRLKHSNNPSIAMKH